MKTNVIANLFSVSFFATVIYLTWLSFNTKDIDFSLEREIHDVTFLDEALRNRPDGVMQIEKKGKTIYILNESKPKSDSTQKQNAKPITELERLVTPTGISSAGYTSYLISTNATDESIYKFFKKNGVKEPDLEKFTLKSSKIIKSGPFRAWSAFTTLSGLTGIVEQHLFFSLPLPGKILIAISCGLLLLLVLGKVLHLLT